MRYLVPGPTPCPEIVAISYIRLVEVPTLLSVEGEAQVERQNTVVGFLTSWIMVGVFIERGMLILVIAWKYTGIVHDIIGLRLVPTWEYAQQGVGYGAWAAVEHSLRGEVGLSSSKLVIVLVGDENLPQQLVLPWTAIGWFNGLDVFGLSNQRAKPIWGSKLCDREYIVNKRMLPWKWKPICTNSNFMKDFLVVMKAIKCTLYLHQSHFINYLMSHKVAEVDKCSNCLHHGWRNMIGNHRKVHLGNACISIASSTRACHILP